MFPDQGIVIDDGAAKPAPEKFVAAKYSSGKVVTTNNLHLIILLINFYREIVSSFSVKYCWKFCAFKLFNVSAFHGLMQD